ncbi:prepilin peptidase-dependent protein [Ewingella sp. AOP8-B2-18]
MEMTNEVKERGMTLIEILVVIALIAMCSLWGLQGWRAYQQSLVLEQHAQRLRSYLTELQAEANAYNRSVILWVIGGSGGCVGQGNKPVRCDADSPAPHFRIIDAEVEITDFTHKVMGFYGIRNAAQAGHITLRNSAGSLRIILSTRGRLRICSEGKAILGISLCV